MFDFNKHLNTIVQGDSLLLLQDIPNETADLVVCDPPYGINYKEWDKIDNFLEFCESWIKECFRILKPNGSFYSFMGWSNVAEFKLLLDKYGYIKNWIVWERNKGRGSTTNYKSVKEELLYYIKSKNDYVFNEQKMLKKHVIPYVKDGKPRGWYTDENGIRCRWTGIGNVWHYTPPFFKMKECVGHPSQKPELMIERIILSSSNENDMVLDPFSGSGTVAVVCQRLGRKFLCIEKDEEYYRKSVGRLNKEIQENKSKFF